MSNPFVLGREGNRVSIAGDLAAHDVRRVFAVIHKTVNDSGYQDIHLDFSHCTAAFSAAMLPICAYALALENARIDCQITLPKNERLNRLFKNTGWANLMCPRDFDPPQLRRNSRQVPASRYQNAEEQNEVINHLLEKLLETIPNFSRTAFSAVEWALNEITDNVLNHSQSKVGGLLQLSMINPARQMVELTVSDAGIGVPASLREARPEIIDDADALMRSVESGVTRNERDFQGNGLYGTMEMCRVAKGKFSLNAGNGAFILNGGVSTAKNENIPFTGTTVDANINFSDPSLLEKALSINGRIHRPVDYIEMQYEQVNSDDINFKLDEHAYSFRSRLAGQPVRTKISNIIQSCPGQRIIIDLHGIPVISSSFADEVFGKLFKELGPMQYIQTIQLINLNATVMALIDRAIIQRMQT